MVVEVAISQENVENQQKDPANQQDFVGLAVVQRMGDFVDADR